MTDSQRATWTTFTILAMFDGILRPLYLGGIFSKTIESFGLQYIFLYRLFVVGFVSNNVTDP